jgi:uncharacterized surface protein with fasciclin (FAS1) repeats
MPHLKNANENSRDSIKAREQKMLQTILTYHVVAGKMNSADIAKTIKMGMKAMLKTVSGGTLTAWMKGKKHILPRKGGMSELQLLT